MTLRLSRVNTVHEEGSFSTHQHTREMPRPSANSEKWPTPRSSSRVVVYRPEDLLSSMKRGSVRREKRGISRGAAVGRGVIGDDGGTPFPGTDTVSHDFRRAVIEKGQTR